MPEHSDSGSGRSIRASSCHLNAYLRIKSTTPSIRTMLYSTCHLAHLHHTSVSQMRLHLSTAIADQRRSEHLPADAIFFKYGTGPTRLRRNFFSARAGVLAWDSTTVQSGLYIVLVSILRSSSAWDAVLLEGFIVAPLTSSPIRADTEPGPRVMATKR